MVKIGITQSETNYQNYLNWFSKTPNVTIIELSYETENILSVADCDGIVFTGGIDIKPPNGNYTNAPNKFNIIRDMFEMQVLELAISKNIPVLGICRGLQLINLYFGGDLILDLEEKNITHKKSEKDKTHSINIVENSLLFNIIGENKGLINSAHHQAINKLAKCLNAVAFAEDGIIEAIELKDNSKQFLMAVQWHPERMENQDSPFSKNIKEQFLLKCQSFKIH